MANKPISMSKVRQIMKLYSNKLGKRKIGERLGISKNTVNSYLAAIHALKIPWDELLKMTDHELHQLIHPTENSPVNSRIQQLYDFFPEMDKQLRRRGMTVGKQFHLFKASHPDAFEMTAFYKYYKMWKNRTYPTMHIEHKVGDKMYVDFAGEKLPYVDEHTGEILHAEVFVAILGWSQYAYVEAMRNQTAEEFIAACENALHFFEGVPLAIVPDNLKSAVVKASKYEPALNANFEAFAEHYGTTILPARARKPQDKSHVENMVKICYQKIYTVLPQQELSTIEELNKKMNAALCNLNVTQLTGKGYSRKDRWLLEVASLQPLCESMFEMREIKQVTVMKNGHVLLYEDKHYYSVPYQFIGKKLRLQYTRTQVEVYDQYKLIAKHKRIRSSHNYSTQEDHMPSTHRYITEWNPQFFLDKARLIDPIVENYLGQVLVKRTHPEQTYKSCQGILSFVGKVGKERLINACRRASDIGYFNYKTIEDILKKHMDKYDEENTTIQMPVHQNIRGGEYYQ